MTTRWMRTVVLAVLGSVATAGIGIATVTSTASAHTELTGSEPTSGAALTTSPTAVSLTFSEDIGPEFAVISVRSSDGRDQPTSGARVSGPRVSADLAGDLSRGGYVVNYRVVSADGHPVSGQVAFTVADSSTTSGSTGPTSAAAAVPAAAPASTDSSSDDETPWLWIAIFGALGAVAGTGIVVVQKRRQRDY